MKYSQARLLFAFSVISLGSLSHFALADEATLAPPTSEQLEHVRSKVVPLLEARCFECHKHDAELGGGLSLASRKAMLKGGESGAAIVPGKPDESLLIEAVRYAGFEMPPRSKMPDAEIAILEKWVADGAVWPKELDVDVAAAAEFPLQARKQSHWAWQPITQHTLPEVQDKSWPKQPADNFVLAKLEAMGLSAAVDADRHTLLRRMYFDLIGLPPTIPQIEAFVNDSSSDDEAMAKVVDELLASPQFGERWGRHWLDLVRYAETLGHEFDYPLHNAWRYRDYVIRAFNADVPYDQFVREHIAGDLLPNPRRNPKSGFNESLIATGFWWLCEDKHAPVDVKREEAGRVDNQIDVFSKTFLGMTVACARCHDHKFDAISTKDYYALAGFLQSSRRETAWLDNQGQISQRVQQLSDLQQQADVLVSEWTLDQATAVQIRPYLVAAIKLTQKKQTFPLSEKSAQEYGNLDSATLQRWTEVLANASHKSADSPLSYLTILANADETSNVKAQLAAWNKTVRPKRKNESNSKLFADLQHGGRPDGWFHTGHAFANQPTDGNVELRSGALLPNTGQGISSASLSKELRGTLTSPTFDLSHPEILIKVAGEGSRVRLVIDGYTMNEFSELLFKGCKQNINTKGTDKWIRLAGDVHRYQGHKAHLEFLDEGNGWFTVKEVRFANKAGSPPPANQHAAINLQLAKHNKAETGARTTEEAVDAWLELATAGPNAAHVTQLLMANNLHPSMVASDEWKTVEANWSNLATGIPAPTPVLALTEGTPENENIFIRGNHLNQGKPAARNILTALQGNNTANYRGSGRLQLTEQLFASDNPLPARVAVNRIWHHLFGKGIVESCDNFGVLGKQPTHPKLLDYLALQFRNNGWSVKQMIRSIVLSRTYRISGKRSKSADIKDPVNKLLHRSRVRRLTGEAARDAILTVSGRLDKTQFGTPVPVKLTAFMQGRGRPKNDGPLDGNGRRSIYISVNRNFLSPFMMAFDVPAPVSTTGRRNVSNVPAQALIMLNNQFVNQQAELWAATLLEGADVSDSKAISSILTNAWLQLFGRPIQQSELQSLTEYLSNGSQDPPELTQESLAELCHVLFNSKEFLFLR